METHTNSNSNSNSKSNTVGRCIYACNTSAINIPYPAPSQTIVILQPSFQPPSPPAINKK